MKALKHSLKFCSFDRVLFLTDRKVDLEEIKIIQISPIQSKTDYSSFVIKELNNYIETDFILLMQYDGFIIHPDSWTSEFQKYDYIGAKWAYTDELNVGNGGFSLRSKRLLQALSKENFSLEPDPFKKGEDHFICRQYRRFLEKQYDIKFAPEALADRFSYECCNPVGNPFGFHGFFNMWRYIEAQDLENFINLLSPKSLSTINTLRLGINYHKMKQFEQAEIIYRKIMQYWPDNTVVLILLDMIYKRTVPDI